MQEKRKGRVGTIVICTDNAAMLKISYIRVFASAFPDR